MKRIMAYMLILTVLSFWIPCASAEISQELDPMVSPDAQATVTGENSENAMDAGQTSNAVSTADATMEDKKVEETKRDKSKKLSKKQSEEKKKKKSEEKKKKKSDEKKKKKSSSKSSKKHKQSSY